MFKFALIYIYTYASTCNLIRKFNAKWHLLFRLYKILIIIANLKHYYELCFVSFFIMWSMINIKIFLSKLSYHNNNRWHQLNQLLNNIHDDRNICSPDYRCHCRVYFQWIYIYTHASLLYSFLRFESVKLYFSLFCYIFISNKYFLIFSCSLPFLYKFWIWE